LRCPRLCDVFTAVGLDVSVQERVRDYTDPLLLERELARIIEELRDVPGLVSIFDRLLKVSEVELVFLHDYVARLCITQGETGGVHYAEVFAVALHVVRLRVASLEYLFDELGERLPVDELPNQLP